MKNNFVAMGLVVALSILSFGCATLVNGTTQDISVITEPSDADLKVDGAAKYTSPAKITLARKSDHMIEITKEGFKSETVNIKSVLSGAVFGNILLGGIGGVVVDSISGGNSKLEPESIYQVLQPIPEEKK